MFLPHFVDSSLACNSNVALPMFFIITSAKTKFLSLNLLSLLYPQTQKNEIEVSLKYVIALTFLSAY
jgi:hypothetical protein